MEALTCWKLHLLNSCYRKTTALGVIDFPGRHETTKWQENSVRVKKDYYVTNVLR